MSGLFGAYSCNYFGETVFVPGGISSVSPDELQVSSKAEDVLKDFRSLDCSISGSHFGYEYRWDEDFRVCSDPKCLAIARERMKLARSGSAEQIPEKLAKSVKVNAQYREFRELCRIPISGAEEGLLTAQVQQDVDEIDEPGLDIQLTVTAEAEEEQVGQVDSDISAVPRQKSKKKNNHNHNNQTASNGLKLVFDDLSSAAASPPKQNQTSKLFPNLPKIHTKIDAIKFVRLNSRLIQPLDVSADRDAEMVSELLKVAERRIENKILQTSKLLDIPKVQAKPPTTTSTDHFARKKIFTLRDTLPSFSLVNNAEVEVTFVWSPARYNVCATADRKKMREMDEKIVQYCESAPPVDRIPSVDDIVFAPYQGTYYYRAKVDELLDGNEKLKVTFIDYGDTSIVKLSDCKEPNAGLMMFLVFGITLELSLSKPCPPDLQLPVHIQSLVDEEQFVMQIESQHGWNWKGKLILYQNATLNELLENHLPDQVPDPRSQVAKQLFPASLTRPQPSQPKLLPLSALISPVEAHLTSLAEQSAPSNSSMPAVVPQVQGTSKQGSTTGIFKKNPFFNMPKPSPNRRFMRNMISSVNLINGAAVRVNFWWNYGRITISALKDDPKLDALAEAIEKHVATDLPAAPGLDRKPEVDEILLAPYQDAYYRGRVTKIEGDNVTVEFIDYGDKATVPYTQCKELTPEINAHQMYGIVFRLSGVPEELPEIPDLQRMLPDEGRIELERQELGLYTGQLWIGPDRNWCEIIKAAWLAKIGLARK